MGPEVECRSRTKKMAQFYLLYGGVEFARVSRFSSVTSFHSLRTTSVTLSSLPPSYRLSPSLTGASLSNDEIIDAPTISI
ncbi:unnamed protein product [Nezara viridula]|uniref:Uncharacterized protein n=1 Tax=Nezara viridula TaxID=85310 RepID=A0A9P0HIW7_NEZVI|nr:unnamed protein product [Nezara viridula]